MQSVAIKKFAFFMAIFMAMLWAFSSFTIKAAATYDYTTSSGYMYSQLKTDAERDFYNELLDDCNNIDDDYVNGYTTTSLIEIKNLTKKQAQEIALLFYHDHPEFFWLMPAWKIRTITTNTDVTNYISFAIYPDYQDGTQRGTTKNMINSVVSSYVSGANKYATQYQKTKYIYERIIASTEYVRGDEDQSVASALIDGKSVCAGYAKAFELICNAAGIECTVEAGFSHAWNAVKIDGIWYLCDATNDDAGSYSRDELFLVSERTMKNYDESLPNIYTATIKSSDGTTQKVTYLMHETDYIDYPNYSELYPKCNSDYKMPKNSIKGDIDGDGITDLPDLMKGDVNGDVIIDSEDATFILADYANVLLNGNAASSLSLDRADFNNDGLIDSSDATEILIYYAQNLLTGS